MPVPEKQCDGECGVGVRPGWVEIHVDRKSRCSPDGDGGKERPTVGNILAGETEGQKQREKTV